MRSAAPLTGSAPLRTGIEPMGDGQMPFSKYIEHEHIEAMRAAFYKVCDALLLNGGVDDPMTEVVVNNIVALAKAMTPTG
jgi:hypothetical protein